MCEPQSFAIASGVAGAAQLGMNFLGQSAAAGQAAENNRVANEFAIKMAKYENERYLRNAASVKNSVSEQTNALVDRANQLKRQAIFRAEREARNARAGSAAVLVSRDETTGQTIAALQNEALRLSAANEEIIFNNLENDIRQTNRQVRGVFARGQNALEKLYPDPRQPLGLPPAGPSPLGLVLGLTSLGFDTASNYLDLKEK
jgi:hypothetical protein